MLRVSGLFVYPIKSLGGISLNEAEMTDRGIRFDRRWMIIDTDNLFISQRTVREMALLQCILEKDTLLAYHKLKPQYRTSIPYGEHADEELKVQIWDDFCMAKPVSAEADGWFSEMLSLRCRLVYMPDDSKRYVDPSFAKNDEINSFSDGYPTLLIGQASLDDLNARMDIPIPMNRFRPNIVFTGGQPYEEDAIGEFSIGDIHFTGVKPCARCAIPTIDQDTAVSSKEPTRTLAKYRAANKNVYFGQNLIHHNSGTIHIGDDILRK